MADQNETPDARIRYALERVQPEQTSWSARELFFLVRKFFPTETRVRINEGAATLCNCGELLIDDRRYKKGADRTHKSTSDPVQMATITGKLETVKLNITNIV